MTKFNLKEHIAKNKATFFGSLNEGQFSWMTQDTDQQIGSQEGNTIPVYMFDNTGKYWFEREYEGYGVFGGKDYYELLDQMNGGRGDRSEGIRKAFDPTTKGETLFPALVVGASNFNYKTHDFTQEAEHDPNQSWLSSEEEEDYNMDREEDYDYSDYDYSDGEELDEGKAAYEYEKGKEAGEKIEKKKMKKSELKAKIKEMIVAEMDGPAEIAKEYDFLAELESMLEADEETDEEADAEATDEVAPEEVDTTVDVTTSEVDPNVKDVQDALTQAQAAAQKLGDPKLTDQIGNTITFFTRSHVVEKPTGAVSEVEEIEEVNESKLTTSELGQLKVGDKVKYLGKDQNGFTSGEQYEVSRKESSSTFQPTITIKNNDGKKLRTNNLTKINQSEEVNESMFPMLKKILK
jgi:hypothetical protein